MGETERAKELFFEALALIDSGDFETAELRLRDALRHSPGHATVLTNLSGVLLQRDKDGEARACAEQALAANPNNIEALLVMAACDLRNERFSEALAAYDKVVSLDPAIAEACNNRGLALQKLGHRAAAVASYERAIAIKPHFGDAHVNRGNSLDDPAEALAAYDQALAIKPGHAQAWLGRGNSLDKLKRTDEALASYDAALTHDPGLASAWLGRGNVLCKLKRYAEGVAAFEKALALAIDLAEAWLGNGNALRELDRADEALAHYDRALALALEPGLALAWLGRGNVFYDLKRYDTALAGFDKALMLSPDLARAWHSRGDVLRTLRRSDEAIAAYQQAGKGLGALPMPVAPPERYIVELFDGFAAQFDQDLIGKLKYRIPEALADVMRRFAPAHPLDILDLGCGTGLMGEQLRPLARTLTGADLSSNMLDKARQRAAYDHLVASDLVRYLQTRAHAFDLAVATDVFIYVGDLSPVFPAVRHALKDGGLFCFSVEAAEEGDFVLRESLRYAHSADYLRRLAQQHRFTVELIGPQVVRQEFGADIAGYCVVMRLAP
jgi:predicted TPR repeat methyltransferase